MLAGESTRALSGLQRLARPIPAAMLGALLMLPALWNDRQADDFVHERLLHGAGLGLRPVAAWDLFRFASGDPSEHQAHLATGLFPWGTAPGFRLAFFRPLSS